MKSIDALIASHLSQVLPPQRPAWFETDDELTTELQLCFDDAQRRAG